jgi:hypothetical protein
MDDVATYEEDVYAWALHQARVLRALAASGLPLPNDLDLEHVAEEIEDMGNELRFQVESHLEQALIHLIKALAQPGHPATPHWMVEVDAFLETARKRWRRSMRRAVDPEEIWADARRRARRIAAEQGWALPPLPAEMPLALDDLLDRDADPRALLARLAAPLES